MAADMPSALVRTLHQLRWGADVDATQTDRVPLTLHLTYKFTLTEAGKVTPKLPLLNK